MTNILDSKNAFIGLFIPCSASRVSEEKFNSCAIHQVISQRGRCPFKKTTYYSTLILLMLILCIFGWENTLLRKRGNTFSAEILHFFQNYLCAFLSAHIAWAAGNQQMENMQNVLNWLSGQDGVESREIPIYMLGWGGNFERNEQIKLLIKLINDTLGLLSIRTQMGGLSNFLH